MKLLFLDTETNGLPANRYASYTDIQIWPQILQISWQILDSESWELLKEEDYFLKLKEPWCQDAERVHQIPESIVQRFGREQAEVLGLLHRDIQESDAIIAHNLFFDRNAILCEYQRLWLQGSYPVKPTEVWNLQKSQLCTMVLTKRYCGIRFADGSDYKFPKLAELFAKLFGTEYDISGASLHNSKHDVSCLVMCYKELCKLPEFSKLIYK